MKYLSMLIVLVGLGLMAGAHAEQKDPHAERKAMAEKPADKHTDHAHADHKDPHAQHKAAHEDAHADHKPPLEKELANVKVPPPPRARTAESQAEAEERARQYFTDLEVVDQNGRRLRFYSDVLKDRVVLISFIFTNCLDACPLITQKLKQIRSLLVPSVTEDIWFVSMSIDPDRDTPEAMKKFAKQQGVDETRWLFITGAKQNIHHIVRKLGQYTEDIDAHSTLMLAGNTRTRHWKRVMPMIQPPGVAAQLRALAEEQRPG